MNEILKYFPKLSQKQTVQLSQLGDLYGFWNAQINVVSRKDIEHLYNHHILHSLAIARIISFAANTKILDVGTGGGFPGIPLAIMFPDAQFTLVDSVNKKIKVVNAVVESLELKNVCAMQVRAEELKQKFDFAVSRAVTDLPTFVSWVWNKIIPNGNNALPNGIIYLKGGDLRDELKATKISKRQISIYRISDFFEDLFFETKQIIYIQR
ncbi:MAG: 16S rRNA (guanine(527)-N(7))-methyltransferase RsmG [Prevotellaceae bacterium]|jgi:16S rRNA (guanine527-N7)-methyltransferase|nr:16S rRNA (guanine(527)-N(7))-methyltransferase RsmG [Prevotellaceae bacterium]